MLSKLASSMKLQNVMQVNDAEDDVASGEAVGSVVALFAGLVLVCNVVEVATFGLPGFFLLLGLMMC